MMTNGDPEGRIFLFCSHTNNGFFPCSPLVLFIYSFKDKLAEVPKITFPLNTLDAGVFI